jgi:hypothetical protein
VQSFFFEEGRGVRSFSVFASFETRQIAQKLGLSGKKVANYVTNILNKLQVADREQVMRLAKPGHLLRPLKKIEIGSCRLAVFYFPGRFCHHEKKLSLR